MLRMVALPRTGGLGRCLLLFVLACGAPGLRLSEPSVETGPWDAEALEVVDFDLDRLAEVISETMAVTQEQMQALHGRTQLTRHIRRRLRGAPSQVGFDRNSCL